MHARDCLFSVSSAPGYIQILNMVHVNMLCCFVLSRLYLLIVCAVFLCCSGGYFAIFLFAPICVSSGIICSMALHLMWILWDVSTALKMHVFVVKTCKYRKHKHVGHTHTRARTQKHTRALTHRYALCCTMFFVDSELICTLLLNYLI